MSFAIWKSKPPFAESDLNQGELIYQIDGFWVVTDQGAPTSEQVAEVIAPKPSPTEAEQLVSRILSSPEAIALLKAELAKA